MLGISEAKYRVLVLAVGCFFVGVAGGVYAHYNRTLSYPLFDMTATLWMFMYVLIGGIGSFAGPVIGTAILMILPELFRELRAFVPYVTAAILFIVVFAMPQGLDGAARACTVVVRDTQESGGNSRAPFRARRMTARLGGRDRICRCGPKSTKRPWEVKSWQSAF